MADFIASNGWLDKFCSRHNISLKILCGESAEVDTKVVENWFTNISEVISGYELKNVFNCDESGLFWKGLPNKTLVDKEDKLKGGKFAKERLTILFCCSAIGENKNPW
jgi:hypothetical protein